MLTPEEPIHRDKKSIRLLIGQMKLSSGWFGMIWRSLENQMKY